MAWRAFDDRIVIGDAWLLRCLRDAVDIGSDCDHRLARAPRRHPRGRNAGDAAFDPERVFLENFREVLGGLDLLEPELSEAEYLIDHLLRELAHRVDVSRGIFLEGVELRVRRARGSLWRGWRLLRTGGHASDEAGADHDRQERSGSFHVRMVSRIYPHERLEGLRTSGVWNR